MYRIVFCRSFFILTTGGTWVNNNNTVYLPLNQWLRITIVYDPNSASGDNSGNMAYVDNEMYPILKEDSRTHRQGTGQMVLGRSYTDLNEDYCDALIDDLKMWNRMLTHEEIIEMGE